MIVLRPEYFGLNYKHLCDCAIWVNAFFYIFTGFKLNTVTLKIPKSLIATVLLLISLYVSATSIHPYRSENCAAYLFDAKTNQDSLETNGNDDFLNLSENKVAHLIDSLFDLDSIPYALIERLNNYITRLHHSNEDDCPENSHFTTFEDNTGYPAALLYRTWNTQTPFDYDGEIHENDTLFVLNLTDSIFNCHFHPPLLDKPNYVYHAIVTSKYGWRNGKKHNGVDLNLNRGDKVYNTFPGMVRMAKYYQGYGNVVIVRHYNGLETLYAHLHRIKVKPGQILEEGDIIGLGGSTGNSTGPHLHLEARFKGIPVNPAHVMCFETKQLHAGELVFKKTRNGYVCYPKGTVIHTVERGDYVYKIAGRYGVSVKQICDLNGLTTKSRLYVGQELRITGN